MNTAKLQSTITNLLEKVGLSGDVLAVLQRAGLVMVIQVSGSALSYGSQVFLARWMGAYEFGIYVFAWSLIQPTAVAAAIGLSMAAVRFVPQYLTKENLGHLHGLIRRSVIVVFSLGTLITAAGWLFVEFVQNFLDDYYIEPLRLGMLCIPFLTLIAMISGISRGFGWVGLTYVPQLLSVPGILLLSAGVYALTVGQPTAVIVLYIAVFACAATALAHVVRFRRAIPGKVKSSQPIFATKIWLRVAFPLFLSDGIFMILWSVDTVMLGSMMGPDEVSIYYASVKTAGLTLIFFNAVTAFAAPKFAALIVDGDRQSQQQFVRSIAMWMFWPTLLVVMSLLLIGPFILGTFGASFVIGQPALVILATGYLVQASTGPTSSYLAVSDNHDSLMWINAGAAITNILLNIVLIPAAGYVGAAIASVASILLYQACSYVLVRRRLGINPFFLART
jgi:O-antigen/teichoic acid export membrane protein